MSADEQLTGDAKRLVAEALKCPAECACGAAHLWDGTPVEPAPSTEEREAPSEYDEEHLRALREGSQPLPRPNGRASAHDLLESAVGDLLRRRGAALRFAGRTREADAVVGVLGEVADLVAQRRALGLRRYGSLLQAGNGRDSLRDALEEVVDLAAYLVVWQEARDEVLVLLDELRTTLAQSTGYSERYQKIAAKIGQIEHLLGGAL